MNECRIQYNTIKYNTIQYTLYVEARKFVLHHSHTWEEGTVQGFSVTLSQFGPVCYKKKTPEILPEYKMFEYKMVT
jgi:hypothetical protein